PGRAVPWIARPLCWRSGTTMGKEAPMSATAEQTAHPGQGHRVEKVDPGPHAIASERLAARVRRFAVQDRLFLGVTFTFALFVLVVLAGLLVSLFIEAWPAFREFGLGFFVGTTWSPADDVYGAVIAVYGTVVSSFIALLIAVPISFGIAVFLTETCPI